MRPNYAKAVQKSVNLLMDLDIKSVPINLDEIFDDLKLTIRKQSYSDFAESKGITVKFLCNYFESDLGACVYDPKTERYIIYYNDTKFNQGLNRFTIAHELGHVFLEHYSQVDSNVLLRRKMSGAKYKRLEREADCFARNLLAPVPLVKKMVELNTPMTQLELQSAFNISLQAAGARLGFLTADYNLMQSQHYPYFDKYKINFGYFCDFCNSGEIEDDHNFCKICGCEANPLYKKHNRIFYCGIKLDSHKRSSICPICKNTKFTLNANHCKMCGSKRFNTCTNCNLDNDGNALWCVDCGSATTFKQLGLLRFTNGDIDLKGVHSVKYDDGVLMNDEFRVLKCPKCGNEEFSDEAQFCRICGLRAYNRCKGEHEDDGYGNFIGMHYHNNHSNARYCETCGQPTEFLEEGILTAWDNNHHEEKEDVADSYDFADVPF